MRVSSSSWIFLCFIMAASIVSAQSFHVKDAADSIVQIAILSPDSKGTIPAGTGFFVAPDMILSDGHVFWEAGRSANEKRTPGWFAQKSSQSEPKQFVVPMDVVKIDDVHDLVLFKFSPDAVHAQWPQFTIKPLKIAEDESQLEMGEDVFLLGYYQSYSFLMSVKGSYAGNTSTSVPVVGGIDEFLLSMDTNYGFSGGPVMLLKSGEVVGVMEGFLPNTPPAQGFANGLSRAVRLKYVKAFLRRLGRRDTEAKYSWRLKWWPRVWPRRSVGN